jgi:hypothetical protein
MRIIPGRYILIELQIQERKKNAKDADKNAREADARRKAQEEADATAWAKQVEDESQVICRALLEMRVMKLRTSRMKEISLLHHNSVLSGVNQHDES